MKKHKPKKRKNKKYSKVLFAIIGILILVLIILAFFEFEILEKMKKKEVVHLEVIDQCSYAMNDYLHQIRDESDCGNVCIARCYTLEKNLKESEFTYNPEGCHKCDCYCK